MSEYKELKEHYNYESKRYMGMQAVGTWEKDPKRLTFVLSRYKFVSKMLFGKDKVLEVGASDAWASRIVKQAVNSLTCIDIDIDFIANASKLNNENWPIKLVHHDILHPFQEVNFDAVYALDVLEHIEPKAESTFMKNILKSLTLDGVVIIGMPSLESQKFSGKDNGHVNCKTGKDFRKFMEVYFKNVFMFSMNDEVLHTGMHEMSNYLLAIGVGQRSAEI